LIVIMMKSLGLKCFARRVVEVDKIVLEL